MKAEKTVSILGGRIIDPANGIDRVGDVFVVDGKFSTEPPPPGFGTVIQARGLIVAPGLIDCHVAFREPGFEEDETIQTGSAAALAGGFTTVACLPDTQPVVETRAAAEFVARQGERARKSRAIPLGAVTKGLAGEELAEIGQLITGGAVGFSDGKRPIVNAEVMRRALQYAGMWGKAILHHPQVPELVAGGVMHEGHTSTVLGLRGMPAAAEEIMVRRDIALAEMTGGRIHLMTISSSRSVEEVRQAKQRGVRVSADVSPLHLLLTDEVMREFDPKYKVDPPFRTSEHRDALIAGLRDGTVEIISSDHQPIAQEKKDLELDRAPFGIAGLETLIPTCVQALIAPGYLDWPALLKTLTIGPATLLGLDAGTLSRGRDGDVVLIDPTALWTIDAPAFQSRSRNTPLHGNPATGRVIKTIVSGEVRHSL